MFNIVLLIFSEFFFFFCFQANCLQPQLVLLLHLILSLLMLER